MPARARPISRPAHPGRYRNCNWVWSLAQKLAAEPNPQFGIGSAPISTTVLSALLGRARTRFAEHSWSSHDQLGIDKSGKRPFSILVAAGLESAMGLVSRASPVQTAVRNCTRDEGGPFGFGDQVADPKPPQAAVVKSHGGERCGNAGTMIPAGTVERGERKRTVSEVSKAD
jgi:hypothetical protein